MGTAGRFAGVWVTAQVWLVGVAPPASADEPASVGGDAAQAARLAGDLVAYRAALREQHQRDPDGPAQAELDRLAAQYGAVELLGPNHYAWLLPSGLSDEALAAIAFARAQLERGDFSGLLPVGHFEVGQVAFDVTRGQVVRAELPEFSIAVAPTCGPCCHGHCPELLAVPMLGPPPEPAPAPEPPVRSPKW